MLGLPAPFVPHSASLSPATATRFLSTLVPVSAPPTSLDECLFSISLVSVPLAVQFSVCSGCARRCICLPTPPSWFPPLVFSLRSLRLYFPALEPWAVWSALLPAVCPVYLCSNVGPQGLLVVRLPAPFIPHSASLHPARAPRFLFVPGAHLRPSYQSGCRTSLQFDFLSVLVVRGGVVCLPMPPSWFSPNYVLSLIILLNVRKLIDYFFLHFLVFPIQLFTLANGVSI